MSENQPPPATGGDPAAAPTGTERPRRRGRHLESTGAIPVGALLPTEMIAYPDGDHRPMLTRSTGTERADAEQSGTGKLGTERSGAERADAGTSGTENSGTENSGTENSGTGNSGTENSGTGNSGTGNSGTNIASADTVHAEKSGVGGRFAADGEGGYGLHGQDDPSADPETVQIPRQSPVQVPAVKRGFDDSAIPGGNTRPQPVVDDGSGEVPADDRPVFGRGVRAVRALAGALSAGILLVGLGLLVMRIAVPAIRSGTGENSSVGPAVSMIVIHLLVGGLGEAARRATRRSSAAVVAATGLVTVLAVLVALLFTWWS